MIFIVLIFSSDYTYYFSDVHIFFFKLFINFLHIVKQMTEAAIPSDVYFPYIRSFKYFNDNILWMRNKCCKFEDAEMKTFMLIAVSVNICEGYIKMAARDCTS